MNRRAFTLIEMLMVIAVIMILAGIGIGGMRMATRRADEADTRSRMERLKNALDQHYRDYGFYPEHDGDFDIEQFDFEDRDGNPYLDEEMLDRGTRIVDEEEIDYARVLDGFRQPFLYCSPGNHNMQSYDLWSLGSDPYDDNTNITNWTR